jgi:hypothetical protein
MNALSDVACMVAQRTGRLVCRQEGVKLSADTAMASLIPSRSLMCKNRGGGGVGEGGVEA